jgi:hypothetical protein
MAALPMALGLSGAMRRCHANVGGLPNDAMHTANFTDLAGHIWRMAQDLASGAVPLMPM